MRTKPKVLLIGWDAADWKVINPLIEAGRMPHLSALIDRGVMGNLATLHPVLSPMLWTSIATGKRPFKHGILGFTEPTPDGGAVQPVSQLSRSTKAIWNILNQEGYKSSVVGWWPSQPVEAINGVMVSNHYHHAVAPPDEPWPLPPASIHPPELSEELAELRFNPNELFVEEVLPFVPKALEIDQDKDKRLSSVMKILAECVSVHNAATWLLDQRSDWDFFAVYYDAIDHFGHGFMKYHPPQQDWISDRDFELYSGVVNAGYEFHDMMLGTMLSQIDDNTTVILCSDHGFHPDHLRPRIIPKEPAGPAVEHRDLGVLVIAGPDYKKDELLHGASVLDVAPTILAQYGLPVGEDMDGKPLLDAFLEPPEIVTIPSWDEREGEDGRASLQDRQDPLAAKAALEQLIALGYVEDPGPNVAKAVDRAATEMRYNLAQSFMDADLFPEAIPILEEIYQKNPTEVRFGKNLAMSYRATGDTRALRNLVEELRVTKAQLKEAATKKIDEFRALLEARRGKRAELRKAAEERGELDSLELPPLLAKAERQEWRRLRQDKFATNYDLDFLMSCVLLDEKDYEGALHYLELASGAESNRPGLHIQVGLTYLKMRRPKDAESAFSKALEIDPLNFHAHLGLARANHRLKRYEEAAASALESVRLFFNYPMAHFVLGSALFRMLRFDDAAKSLEVAVRLNPNFAEAHRMLARLYRLWTDNPEGARRARQALAEIRKLRSVRRDEVLALMKSEFSEASEDEKDTRPDGDRSRNFSTPVAETVRVNKLPSDESPRDFVSIVAGLPRSGTSMLMQMLDAGGLTAHTDEKRISDEDNPKGYFESEDVTRLRSDAQWFDKCLGKSVKVVAQLLPFVPEHLPCRILFIEREAEEVIKSQRIMLQRKGKGEEHFDGDQIKKAYDHQLRLVRAAIQNNPNALVLYVRHRDVVGNPSAEAAKINAFLGGELDVSAMAEAVDPELYRNRVA